MDRKIRSATYGPVSDESAKGAAKYFAAVGAFFTRKKTTDHRVVRRRLSPVVLRDVPKTEDELEAEELDRLDELEAWHRIVREVAVLQRERATFEDIIETQRVELEIAEAFALMTELNEAFGWEPGEPEVANRMFNIDVRKLLNEARNHKTINFRARKVIDVMRRVGRSASVSKSKTASIAAVRNLVGGVTVSEAQLLEDEKRLKADSFAEYVGFADRLSRAQERAMANKLGRTVSAPTSRDYISIADSRRLQSQDRAF